MYLKTLPLSSGFANRAKKTIWKVYFPFSFACHALPYRVNYPRPVLKLTKGSVPMKKTIFLSLISLLILVGCNNEDPTATPGPTDNGATTEAPDSDTPADNPPPASDVTVGFEIGNQAPEISGEDIDGVAFKLSDYRGKVVVLDFWGDW
jgi:hypothetical protein